ncbi:MULTISPECIES: hypothetical protein [unclassified Nocardioides]|nr:MULTISPECIES: hypothetical protein [unclassified Nocardioides]
MSDPRRALVPAVEGVRSDHAVPRTSHLEMVTMRIVLAAAQTVGVV